MMQSRTHNCGELRAQHAGEHVKLVGWMENVREVGGSLAFVVLRDFYGTTQIVIETSELLAQIKGYQSINFNVHHFDNIIRSNKCYAFTKTNNPC